MGNGLAAGETAGVSVSVSPGYPASAEKLAEILFLGEFQEAVDIADTCLNEFEHVEGGFGLGKERRDGGVKEDRAAKEREGVPESVTQCPRCSWCSVPGEQRDLLNEWNLEELESCFHNAGIEKVVSAVREPHVSRPEE